ncbi:MAG: DUF433 domain-containing protein [Acidobacteriota bacterium]
MTRIEATQTIPLMTAEDGTIRITGSRVSLDSIIHHFKLGATAEEIAYKFPAVSIADIYAVIAYYLSNREAIENYLSDQEVAAAAAQQRIESNPEYQSAKAEMRERLLERRSAHNQNKK